MPLSREDREVLLVEGHSERRWPIAHDVVLIAGKRVDGPAKIVAKGLEGQPADITVPVPVGSQLVAGGGDVADQAVMVGTIACVNEERGTGARRLQDLERAAHVVLDRLTVVGRWILPVEIRRRDDDVLDIDGEQVDRPAGGMVQVRLRGRSVVVPGESHDLLIARVVPVFGSGQRPGQAFARPPDPREEVVIGVSLGKGRDTARLVKERTRPGFLVVGEEKRGEEHPIRLECGSEPSEAEPDMIERQMRKERLGDRHVETHTAGTHTAETVEAEFVVTEEVLPRQLVRQFLLRQLDVVARVEEVLGDVDTEVAPGLEMVDQPDAGTQTTAPDVEEAHRRLETVLDQEIELQAADLVPTFRRSSPGADRW